MDRNNVHSTVKDALENAKRETRYCECGCGEKVFNRFVRGHHSRLPKEVLTPEQRSERDAEYRREYYYRVRLGLSVEEVRELRSRVTECQICGGPPTNKHGKFSLDHNHVTGQVRGLLCQSCNIGLGGFGDNVENLIRAIEYLNHYESLA